MFLLTFAALSIFVVGWTVYGDLTWRSRVRQRLEHDGFRVRHMERRWLTRGPFSDMRLPGAKGGTESLIRVVAENRDGQLRAGWVRFPRWPGWAPKLPWDVARYEVRWDEAPLSSELDIKRECKTGLSSVVFMLLILPPALAGMLGALYLLTSWL
jgi:hypothetical protein